MYGGKLVYGMGGDVEEEHEWGLGRLGKGRGGGGGRGRDIFTH